MKLQIVTDDNQHISGFEQINVVNGECKEMDDVINHSCTEILAIDCLEKFPYDKSVAFFGQLLQKVRLGGSIIFRGLNLISIGQQTMSGLLDAEGFSKLIANCHCIHDPRNIVNVLERENFVVTTNLRGVHYEIKATRKLS